MRTTTLLLLLAAVVILSGCGEVERLIVKKQYVYNPIPEKLTRTCAVTVPPKPTEYIQLTADQKEDTLTNYSISLLKDLDNCNAQIKEINGFQDVQIKEVEKLNKATP